MKTNKTLIVVDMQPHFLEHIQEERERECICGCKNLIGSFRYKGLPIVFVEYSDNGSDTRFYGKTIRELRKEVKDYANLYTVLKTRNDGSFWVHRLVRREKLPASFVVCGVFLEYCVKATATGLAKMFPQSTVIVDRFSSQPHFELVTYSRIFRGYKGIRFPRNPVTI
jgi:nicotinamidase-related amidase